MSPYDSIHLRRGAVRRIRLVAAVGAVAGLTIAAPGCVVERSEEPDAVESTAPMWRGPAPAGTWTGAVSVEVSPDEPRFRSLTRLTSVGTNAEAYFSAEGDRLIFQSTWPGVSECDQMYTMALDGSDLQLVSTGEGRTTCGYYFPGKGSLLFASTHLISPICPPAPDRSRGYVWGLFDYDLFTRDLSTGQVRQLTSTPGYDAEATISRDGTRIVYTSMRSGDLDLWAMNADGTGAVQLTDDVGYEGGAFFSPDGSRIVYRAFIPQNDEEMADYRMLLAQQLVRGGRLEVFVMNADGSGKRQVTRNGASNFAPFFHPNGDRIVFSSNQGDPSGRSFAIYMIGLDGAGQERITSGTSFNSFPMFSPDGRYLAFSSDRGAEGPGIINIFLAEWADVLPAAAR